MSEKPEKGEEDEIPMNNLERIRTDRGLTLKQLAALSGLSPAELSRWEKGKRAMTTVHIAKLAKALSISPSELLDVSSRGFRIMVTAKAEADKHRVSPYFDGDFNHSVYIPPIENVDMNKLIAVEVDGDAAHSKYQKGTIVVIAKLTKEQQKGGNLVAKKRYLVESINAEGHIELTIRLLDFDPGGKMWLSFELPEPWLQRPTPYYIDGPSLRIVGIVLKAITDE